MSGMNLLNVIRKEISSAGTFPAQCAVLGERHMGCGRMSVNYTKLTFYLNVIPELRFSVQYRL